MAKLKEMLVDNKKQKAIKEGARRQEEAEAVVLEKKQEEKRDKHVVEIQKKQQQKFNSLIASTADVGVKAQEDAIRAEKEVRRRQRAYAQRGCQRQRHVLGQGGLDVRESEY